eukprot:4454038-Pyramimonas_sp.AAC.1
MHRVVSPPLYSGALPCETSFGGGASSPSTGALLGWSRASPLGACDSAGGSELQRGVSVAVE